MNLLAFTPFGFEVPLPVVTLGLITGTTYGLLAAGLVLVYRTNRVINFAHGEIGVFGAAVFAIAVTRWHMPYYTAVPVALAAAGLAAAVSEVAIVRRLRNAPRLMSIVATLGVGQFLVVFTSAINPSATTGISFPSPPGLPEWQFGPLRMTQAYVGMLIFGPIVVVALTLFLRHTRYGLGMRCAASNPEAARMSGISISRMSTLAWVLAGILSTFTAMLVLPASGFSSGESFGPALLVRALAGAVVARMTSLPIALAAGMGIGVLDRLLAWNFPRANLVEVVLYVVILGALLLQRSVGSREDEKGSWVVVQGWRPLPESVARLRAIRVLPWVLAGVSLAAAALLPLWVSHANSVILTSILCFAMVGMALGVVTGLGGQLSLGQFAIASIGALVSYHVSLKTGSFVLSFLYAGLGAGLVALFIGLPALRLRGVMLTVTTLGFAVVSESWLLRQSWSFSTSVVPERAGIFGRELTTAKSYYMFVLLLFVMVFLLCWNVKRGGLGRRLRAVRDNEDGARAFTVPARLVKLQGFVLAGFVAGIAGAAFGHMLSRLGADAFPVKASVNVAAMAVLGGLSLLVGPLLGTLYIVGIPSFLPLDSAGLAATQLGWLLLILYLPGGLTQVFEPLRRMYAARVAHRHGIDLREAEQPPPSKASPAVGPIPASVLRPAHEGRRKAPVLLEAVDLRKRFGGVAAVNGVSFEVRSGEIVGLIGPNGAGKTTTFELLGGFTRQDGGKVLFDGEDVSDLGPEERAKRGLIRSFQDAALFPTMTVLDAARLAFERTAPTSFAGSLLGLPGAERDKDRKAHELVGAMGLFAYRYRQIGELSTGTRRIAELACLIALQPTLLLLDEPSSGIAQRETEALGRLLARIREELDLTMVVIEHDIPLIMGLSDRIVAMESGSIITVGSPAEVRTNPRVVEAYLGGSTTAIERSDAATTNGHAPKTRRTRRPGGTNGKGQAEDRAPTAAITTTKGAT